MPARALRLCVFVLFATGPLRADLIHDALNRLYNFDFAGAHRILDSHIAAHPADPLGHAIRSSALLFYELHRLKILEAEFFESDKRIAEKKNPEADPKIRQRLFEAIDTAQRLASVRLQANPGDTTALFSFCVTEGVRTDYRAFVERKQLSSLSIAKKAQGYAMELIKRDPTYVDAYLTKGISEYLIGSLPFFIRWFVRFEQTKGSKEEAVENLEKVARSGRYMGPFARILLSIIHLREKRPKQAYEIMKILCRDFPENPLFRTELAKLEKGFK
jgi:hypothetical protein